MQDGIVNFDSDEDIPFDPAAWIGVEKVYRDVPAQVATACKAARTLPSSLIRQLPATDVSVTEFLTILLLPNVLDRDAPFPKRPSNWFSEDLSNATLRSLESRLLLEFIR
ncbi:hypothetical protein DFH09DRAFT_1094554 [Mycena vulgaris]|nr:hypothetical protein DFH09DRAFT_1094554 [Mycena vulgaris]